MRVFFAAIAAATLIGRAAPQRLAFEVASIKPNATAAAGSYVGRQPGGRFRADNATLVELIEYAYQVPPFRVAGGPDWAASDRWNIVAKLESVPPPPRPGVADDTVLALRALLQDRFQLEVRPQTRELPSYALLLDRSDGRLGPQLSRSTIDCAAMWSARSGGAPPANARACGIRGRIGSVQSVGASMREFADALSEKLQRQVVDRTALGGGWDFMLAFAQDPSPIAPGVLPADTTAPPADPDKPSLFTALREQLGLKLEATRAPVEVIVIDRAARPTAN